MSNCAYCAGTGLSFEGLPCSYCIRHKKRKANTMTKTKEPELVTIRKEVYDEVVLVLRRMYTLESRNYGKSSHAEALKQALEGLGVVLC